MAQRINTPKRITTKPALSRYHLNTIAAVAASIEEAADGRDVQITGTLTVTGQDDGSYAYTVDLGTLRFSAGNGNQGEWSR